MSTESGTNKMRFNGMIGWKVCLLALCLSFLQACATGHADVYRDSTMDFGSIKSVAVLPFGNLARDAQGSDRVRDVFTTALLATGAFYVLPPGEVARGIIVTGMANPTAPATDEVTKLCKTLKVDAVMTGIVREYGEVKSGSASADLISLSMQMLEGQTGRIVWSAATTKGGVVMADRLLGGGGRPLNDVTEKAVYEIINKLFD